MLHRAYRLTLVAALLGVAAACGDASNPFSSLSATTNADDFVFVAQTFEHSVTTTLRYNWEHSGTVAEVIQGTSTQGAIPIQGTANITIRDGSGVQVYAHDLKENRSDTTIAGSPGTWTINLEFANARGDVLFEVRKAARELTVTASTSGTNPDDGYTATIDGGVNQAVAANGVATFANLSSGTHTVVLSGVAANCTVMDGASRAFTVPAGIGATVAYVVTCS